MSNHKSQNLNRKTQLTGLLAMLGALFAFLNLVHAITTANTSFTPQAQPVGYVAQNEVTNFNLTGGNKTLYRSDYEREFWSGNLFAYPVDANGAIDLAAERWSGGAAAQLARQSHSTRLIATRNEAVPSTAVEFTYANLSPSQQAYFPTTSNNGGKDSFTGTQIVDFLRGDRSNEGAGLLRIRSAGDIGTGGPVLGDIIHSRPLYVPDIANPTIFVGANDGMLHAFDANEGKERWAYVPSMLLNKMVNLAKPYDTASNPHDYFVDGQLALATLADNSRILVGALGAGGRGLYALTVTGSAGLAATSITDVTSKARWEINGTTGKLNNDAPTTADAYYNLGYTYGQPLIVKVNTGEDAVIIGNGYNNNSLGDYHAYLYVINASNGQLIGKVATDTSGSSSSPNGIFNVAAIDTNNDGKADRVYGGDLYGRMWKFDISSSEPASWSASILHTTSPLQPITSTPAVSPHPNGGYMVNFGTGTMLNTDDTTDTSTYYVYGIWDGPYSNSTMLTQTLEERSFTYSGNTTRVRRVTNNAPNWTDGGTKGWRVALPAGERIVGEGSFIENGRYYFTSHNPTVSELTGGATVTSITLTSGGSGYTSAPTVTITGGGGSGATATAVLSTGTTVWGENWLMELNYLNGGSSATPFFDLDENLLLNDDDRIKYTASDTLPSGKSVGDAIISPSEEGIPVGKMIATGVVSQPILVQSSTMSTTLFNRNPNAIFHAVDVLYGVTGGHFDFDVFVGRERPTGLIIFSGNSTGTNSKIDNDLTIPQEKCTGGTEENRWQWTCTITDEPGTIQFGNYSIYDDEISLGDNKTPEEVAAAVVAAIGNHKPYYKAYVGGTNITRLCSQQRPNVVCIVDTSTYWDNGKKVGIGTLRNFGNISVSTVDTSGGGALAPNTCDNGDSNCNAQIHLHQYDDLYNKTGVDILNPSYSGARLELAIPDPSKPYKVLMQNQYLSPAVKIHIGNAAYEPSVDVGYISVKDFGTSPDLKVADLPTYTGYSKTTGNIGSLVLNMPTDALTAKDWWGNGDVRAGLHPTQYWCVNWSDSGIWDGNMYRPVIPPPNGTDGPGIAGWSSSTTQTTATGARHNGALTLQIIRDDTPQDMIEENVSGRPEYGWRVKAAGYSTYVLAEYAIYWHHPNGKCYHEEGWTKAPGADNDSTQRVAQASGSTDPKLGDLGYSAGGTVTDVTITVSGNVTTTTITYTTGGTAIITRTANDDGTITVVTRDADCVAAGDSCAGVTETIQAPAGSVAKGGNEGNLRGRSGPLRTGRISWHELIND